MRTPLAELLASRDVLLADGATATNYYRIGLVRGEPPELWNVEHPDRVAGLHRRFVDAGADVILTNSFGGSRQRLALHGAGHLVRELNERGALIARAAADEAERPVVVAGSVGPTGELPAPVGSLDEATVIASFRQQIDALGAGGVDVVWIETMWAAEELRAAAHAAIAAGLPYVVTCSFDTAGRTGTGLSPDELAAAFDGLAVAPLAIGANCGAGPADVLVSVLALAGRDRHHHGVTVVAKANCGLPQRVDTEIVHPGTPELMGRHAALAADAGARIVGGCCGTSPEHVAVMRRALDERVPGTVPTIAQIVEQLGPPAAAGPGQSGRPDT